MKLLLIRGLPGSGKTTLARQLVEAGEYDCHFEADMYFCLSQQKAPHPLAGVLPEYPLARGKYYYDPALVATAHHWCQLKTATALGMGRSVVVSNTFVERWEVELYRDIAARFPVPVPVEIRTATGRFKNVHGVPEHVLRIMEKKWEEVEE